MFFGLSGVFHESEIVAVFGLAGLFRVCELMSVLVGGLLKGVSVKEQNPFVHRKPRRAYPS